MPLLVFQMHLLILGFSALSTFNVARWPDS